MLQFSFSKISTWAGSSILWRASIDILTDVLVDMSVATRLTLDWYIRRLLTESWLIAHQYIGRTSTYDVGRYIRHNWRLISQLPLNYRSVKYIYTQQSVNEVSLKCHCTTDFNGWYICNSHWLTMTLVASQLSIGPILVEFQSSNDQHIVTLQYIGQYVNWRSP